MAKTFPITQEQRQFLASFRCERLKDDSTNEARIHCFSNKVGELLVDKLQKVGWKEDNAGSTAYYVIKNKDGEIVLFFSLKCGVLFNTNKIQACLQNNYSSMWEELLSPEEAALPALQCLRSQDPMDVLFNLTDPESEDSLYLLQRTLGMKRTIAVQKSLYEVVRTVKRSKIDKKFEPNRNIIRVPETFSAIELVEFCRDENTSACWDKKFMGGRSIGEGLFWEYVVPKMLQVNDLIGCEYVFLFAADQDLQPFTYGIGGLIKHYRKFHFDYAHDLGTAKPNYDFGCQFMYQRLRSNGTKPGLDTHMNEFFDTFNEDSAADDYV